MTENVPFADDGVDERVLVEKCLAGDTDAFEPLVRKYRVELTGIAYHLLGNAGDAEEAAQEAFYRAYKALGGFEPEREFGHWLRRILVNYCLDIQRQKQRAWAMRSYPVELPNQGLDSSDMIKTLINTSLKGLPARQRAVVVLRDIKGYPSAEVAGILGTSESTVRVHLFHGRRKLRKIYRRLEKQYKEWEL